MKTKILTVFVILLSLTVSAVGCGSTSGETTSSENAQEAAVGAENQSGDGEAKNETSTEVGTTVTEDSDVPDVKVLDLGETVYMGIIKDGGFVIEVCKTQEEDLVVPDTIYDMPVVKIAKCAFTMDGTRSVTLPDTVQEIALEAFYWGQELEIVNFGSGLVKVGADIFSSCPRITEIRFPEGMTTIGGRLCTDCPALEKIYIPGSVTLVDLLEDENLVDLETCPNVTIVTPEGSAAETAAMACGIPVEHS